MSLSLIEVRRRPFDALAVQITDENLEAVAQWCDGTVKRSTRTVRDSDGKPTGDKIKGRYIKMNTPRPINPRYGRGYIGDYIVLSPDGYRVYSAHAYRTAFQQTKSKAPATVNKPVSEEPVQVQLATALQEEQPAEPRTDVLELDDVVALVESEK